MVSASAKLLQNHRLRGFLSRPQPVDSAAWRGAVNGEVLKNVIRNSVLGRYVHEEYTDTERIR